jgi:diguanylate cyclase (GGDEF)-like protein
VEEGSEEGEDSVDLAVECQEAVGLADVGNMLWNTDNKLKERIKELEATVKSLEKDLIHDRLTGLMTRAYFEHEGQKHVRQVSETYQPVQRREWAGFDTLSVLFMDIDDFKKINDTYGHYTGDEVLKKVSDAIRESIRETDIAARWGGEELAVMLVGAGTEVAKRKASEILEKVRGLQFEEKNLHVTLSIGIASVDEEIEFEKLVRRADGAMYEAKRRGKNQTLLYSEIKHE